MARHLAMTLTADEARRAFPRVSSMGPKMLALRLAAAIPDGGEVLCMGGAQYAFLRDAVTNGEEGS